MCVCVHACALHFAHYPSSPALSTPPLHPRIQYICGFCERPLSAVPMPTCGCEPACVPAVLAHLRLCCLPSRLMFLPWPALCARPPAPVCAQPPAALTQPPTALTHLRPAPAGLPIRPLFSRGLPGRRAMRRRLGLDPALPAILLVGGGEGMGALEGTVAKLGQELGPTAQVCGGGGEPRAMVTRGGTPQHTRTHTRVYSYFEGSVKRARAPSRTHLHTPPHFCMSAQRNTFSPVSCAVRERGPDTVLLGSAACVAASGCNQLPQPARRGLQEGGAKAAHGRACRA